MATCVIIRKMYKNLCLQSVISDVNLHFHQMLHSCSKIANLRLIILSEIRVYEGINNFYISPNSSHQLYSSFRAGKGFKRVRILSPSSFIYRVANRLYIKHALIE
jgi:hypothetical protein